MNRRRSFHGTDWESLEGRQLLSGVAVSMRHGIHIQLVSKGHVGGKALGHGHVGPVNTIVHGYRTTHPGKAVAATVPAVTAANPNAVIRTPIAYIPPQGSAPAYYPAGLQSLSVFGAAARSSGGRMISMGGPVTLMGANTSLAGPVMSGASVSSTAATTPTNGTTAPGVANPPKAPAPVTGLVGNVTLNSDEVHAIKAAVDTFASNFTSGTNALQDKTAASDLKAQLGAVALSVWSREHVLSKGDVSALQSAVDSFARNYTSGTNPASDQSAWQTLQSAMTSFAGALNPPPSSTTATGTTSKAATTPGAPPMPGSGPLMIPLPDGGVSRFVDALTKAPAPLSSADLTSLQTAVDAFTANYTSGKDSLADRNASDALNGTLTTLVIKYLSPLPLAHSATIQNWTAVSPSNASSTPASASSMAASGPKTLL